MSFLVFKRSEKKLYLLSKPYRKIHENYVKYTNVIGKWPAHNEVDSSSNGKWPDGTYPYERYNPHLEVDELTCKSTAYGCNGNRMFTVEGRKSMGIHAGRIDGVSDRSGKPYNVKDGLGMMVTMGCIRTTDQAMEIINKKHDTDKITHVIVKK